MTETPETDQTSAFAIPNETNGEIDEAKNCGFKLPNGNGDFTKNSEKCARIPLNNGLDRNLSCTLIEDEGNSSTRQCTDDALEQPAKRSKRQRKKPGTAEQSVCTCPMCNQPLRQSELQGHLQWEVERLNKFCKKQQKECSRVEMLPPSSTTPNTPSSANGSRPSSPLPGPSEEHAEEGDVLNEDEATMAKLLSPELRYSTFKEIRQKRLKRQQAKRKRPAGEEEATCPVCDEIIVGSSEIIADHVDACLRQQEQDEDAVIDIEGEDSNTGDGFNNFEEYTWAGQTRVRLTTMLEGPLANHGFQTTVKGDEDEEVDIDIDDDTNLFGPAQYQESDVIPCVPDEVSESRERLALRRAVLSTQSTPVSDSNSLNRWEFSSDSFQSGAGTSSEPSETNPTDPTDSPSSGPKSNEQIISSLQAKIKAQQALVERSEQFKCLICMEGYLKPLTSVLCWHVHCEECWLRSLGAKKVCPQCNLITAPGDLRRIYL